jgi:hypothetical protein
MRVRTSLVAVAALAAALAFAACGEDDFENNPRPPAPIDLSALINDRQIVISPSQVGAGLATITVSNQSDDPATLTMTGPNDIATAEILPGDTGAIKGELKEGDYEVTAGEASPVRATTLAVGPERPSSQNELLLP